MSAASLTAINIPLAETNGSCHPQIVFFRNIALKYIVY